VKAGQLLARIDPVQAASSADAAAASIQALEADARGAANQVRAAHLLGINRNTLRKKIKELGIKGPFNEEGEEGPGDEE
jgi:multidrug resistance efflux pump